MKFILGIVLIILGCLSAEYIGCDNLGNSFLFVGLVTGGSFVIAPTIIQRLTRVGDDEFEEFYEKFKACCLK